MSAKAHIRRAAPADIKAGAKLHVEAWRQAYRGLMPAEYLASLSIEEFEPSWKKALESMTEDRLRVVAESEGRIVGFVGAGAARWPGPPRPLGHLAFCLPDPKSIVAQWIPPRPAGSGFPSAFKLVPLCVVELVDTVELKHDFRIASWRLGLGYGKRWGNKCFPQVQQHAKGPAFKGRIAVLKVQPGMRYY